MSSAPQVGGVNVYQSHLLDLGTLLREQYADKSRQRDDFENGRRMALMSVLSLMIQQADAFGIARANIGLADFDPENELA